MILLDLAIHGLQRSEDFDLRAQLFLLLQEVFENSSLRAAEKNLRGKTPGRNGVPE
jgi:hypothetical protein